MNTEGSQRKYRLVLEASLFTSLTLAVMGLHLPFGESAETIKLPDKPIILDAPPSSRHPFKEIRPTKPSTPVASTREDLLLDETIDNTEVDPLLPVPIMPVPLDSQMETTEPFLAYDEDPVLIGGDAFIRDNVRYPSIAKQAGMEGSVLVQLLIDEVGRVVECTVMTEEGNAGFGSAATEVLMKAKFKPAKQRDRAVRCRISMKVDFKLK